MSSERVTLAKTPIIIGIVDIPCDFVKNLQLEFLNVSSQTVRSISGVLIVDGLQYSYEFDTEDIFNLSRMHEEWQSNVIIDMHYKILVKSEAKNLWLKFAYDDLRWMFYTVDKVTAGADPVVLVGDMEIEEVS